MWFFTMYWANARLALIKCNCKNQYRLLSSVEPKNYDLCGFQWDYVEDNNDKQLLVINELIIIMINYAYVIIFVTLPHIF